MVVFRSIFRIAFDAIISNKLRSSLTFIGIVFGVTSVMTIISALEGMMGVIEEEFSALGPSTFMVSKMMTAMSDEEFREKIKRKPVNLKAVEAIEESCTMCEKISPRAFVREKVKYREKSIRRALVMGCTAEYIDIVDIEVEQGRFHSFEDDTYRRQVAFIGDDLREEFFTGVDPLGKVIKIGGRKYTVVGLAKKRGEMFGESQDDFIVVPLSAYTRQFGQPRRGVNVVIKAASVEQLEETMDEVRVILRSHRNVPYNKPDDFDMMTADSFLELLNQITRIFRLGLIGISGISLIVGGIVVMNIMMVSVAERTREIGIRKSLGAKHQHILMQFLFESILLTFSGGVVGIVLGYLIARILVGMLDMTIAPSMMAIISGLSISIGIGLVFGIYPAMKAARLDPVKALSYE
ncbi:MAG: FtsX-like permease family protein [bacterium]|nr:FtsX-like permease family protein [bacterium]